MTNDEAVARASAAGECFVVFDGDTGEVREVTSDPAAELDPATELQRLQGRGAVVGRFFAEGTLTHDVIEEQQRDCRRIAIRRREYPLLQRADANRLTRILEGGEALDSAAFDLSFEVRWIVPAIFELRREELDEALVERVYRLRDTFEPSLRVVFDAYVAGWRRDRDALWRIWPSDGRDDVPIGVMSALLDGYAHLDERSPAYVDALVRMLGTMPFGDWFPAVIALGRVGASAGPDAARAIRRTVWDSEPRVTATRDRVLDRIESTEAEWRRCNVCEFGSVIWNALPIWQRIPCNECLGVAFVREGRP